MNKEKFTKDFLKEVQDIPIKVEASFSEESHDRDKSFVQRFAAPENPIILRVKEQEIFVYFRFEGDSVFATVTINGQRDTASAYNFNADNDPEAVWDLCYLKDWFKSKGIEDEVHSYIAAICKAYKETKSN